MYVVEQDKAEIRAVRVDRQVDDLAVVASGLKAGETVVTRTPRNLRPGAKVVSADATEKPHSAQQP